MKACILFVGLVVAVLGFSLARAQAPVMLGLGDSIGEGVQSTDANYLTQPRSYLNLLALQIGIPFPLPLIETGPLGVVGDTSQRFRLFPDIEAANLSVSGATVSSLLTTRADASSEGQINSETDLVLFPRMGSQVEIAEALHPLIIVCWIGNNDVLSAVTSFDQLDASQMTPVEQFSAGFNEIADRLSNAGEFTIFANIPDVTRIGFLVDRQDLVGFLGSDFGLAEGSYTSIVAMLLMKLDVNNGSLLQNPDFVLDAQEVARIQERVAAFNQIINEAAYRLGMPVVDIHGLYNQLTAQPPVLFGTPLSHRFLGGIFSLDGVHPSNITHALIANAFIDTINAYFQVGIPRISDDVLARIFLTDPFVDKDGDGKVRGRFGAGQLETAALFLGISGDLDELPYY